VYPCPSEETTHTGSIPWKHLPHKRLIGRMPSHQSDQRWGISWPGFSNSPTAPSPYERFCNTISKQRGDVFYQPIDTHGRSTQASSHHPRLLLKLSQEVQAGNNPCRPAASVSFDRQLAPLVQSESHKLLDRPSSATDHAGPGSLYTCQENSLQD
jgi:hypothetical protein